MTSSQRVRRFALVAVVGLLVWIIPSAASADVTSKTRKTNHGTSTAVTAKQSAGGAEDKPGKPKKAQSRTDNEPEVVVPAAQGGGGSEPEPIPTYAVVAFRGAPGADNACVARLEVPVGTTVSGTTNVNASIREHLVATGSAPPPCNTPPPAAPPADPGDPAAPAAPVPAGPSDAELLLEAQAFIDTLVPPPGLTTEPPRNEGFVGVPVLVQLGHDNVIDAPARTVSLFGSDYTLTAQLRAETTVAWGDGEDDGGITRPGATYDQVDGDLDDERLIRHVYTDRGPVTITATDTWTVELTLEGVGTNTVTGITRTESAAIDVIEMQSVLTNG